MRVPPKDLPVELLGLRLPVQLIWHSVAGVNRIAPPYSSELSKNVIRCEWRTTVGNSNGECQRAVKITYADERPAATTLDAVEREANIDVQRSVGFGRIRL